MKFDKIIYIGFVEKWKKLKIDGHPTNYQVSNLGNVRNIKNKKKILKTNLDKDGYEQICIYYNHKKHVIHVHRLVALMFIKNPHNLPQVNHKDGIKHHNEVSNLEWCTSKENVIHAYKTGLHNNVAKGSNHGLNKYSEDQIKEVCILLEENKKTFKEIQDITGVRTSTIHDIISKKYWTYISSKYKIDNYNQKAYNYYGEELKQQIIALAKQGKSTSEMRKILNLPYNDSLNIKMRRIIKQYQK